MQYTRLTSCSKALSVLLFPFEAEEEEEEEEESNAEATACSCGGRLLLPPPTLKLNRLSATPPAKLKAPPHWSLMVWHASKAFLIGMSEPIKAATKAPECGGWVGGWMDGLGGWVDGWMGG